jgi:K+-sensing histidine kinase KdpD
VTVSLPSDVCAVHTDAQMLSIVLSNVLENAYKYSPPDSLITLQLVPHAGEHTEPGWRWTVENTVGDAGYPEADKVFDKYYRSAAAQRQSGSGLGLFLVKSLLDLMRGQVAYTPLQQRVRFEVWVPCDASKTHKAA